MLVPKATVNRHEGIEYRLRERQESAVLYPAPIHVRDRPHVMVWETRLQFPARQALVKQNAHDSGGLHFEKSVLRLLQKCRNLLSVSGREVGKELVKVVACGEIVDEVLDGHSGS